MNIRRLSILLSIVAFGLSVARAEEPHVSTIVARLTQTVASLKAADPSAVPMAFWDFDGTIIKGDIGLGFEEPDGRSYRGLLEGSILAGLTPVYSGDAGYRQWRDVDYPRFGAIGTWLSQAYDVQMYVGTPVSRLEAFTERTVREDGLDRWYFASSMAIWRALERLGVENYVVSANIEPLLRGVAPSLGIPRERVRATRADLVDGCVTTKILHPIPCGPGKVEAVREFILARKGGVAVAGFGNSYGTDGNFLRYICSQPLPGGAKPLSVMINGGSEPKAYKGLFMCVKQDETVGTATRSPARTVLDDLKAKAVSDSFYYAWTHVWMTPWPMYGDMRHVIEKDGRVLPKPTDEVVLKEEIAEKIGVAPKLYYSDLAGIAGTWHSDRYYTVNRAAFAAVIRKAWKAYRGVCVFSWHMDHPCTTNGFRACSYRYKCAEHKNVVGAILKDEKWPCGCGQISGSATRRPTESPRVWFMRQLEDIAAFFNTLVDEDGRKIPVIVRYAHEMDGGWFWWGKGWCSADEFAEISRLEADTLRRLCGNDQILFAYTPDRHWKDLGRMGDGGGNFLSWYPGDAYVDIVGFDDYSIGKGGNDASAKKNFDETVRKLRLVSAYAKSRGKVAAITECGCENARDDIYDCIFRLMTADGVQAAFVDTWSGKYTLPPENPRIVDGLKAFVAKPQVLTVPYPITKGE